jgi:hypothetical protein
MRTTLGTLIITKVEILSSLPGCDETYCVRAAQGRKLLVVWLERLDGGDLVDVTDFLSQSISVTASAGSSADIGAAAFDRSVGSYVVFAPPRSAHDFILHWPNNPPVELGQ